MKKLRDWIKFNEHNVEIVEHLVKQNFSLNSLISWNSIFKVKQVKVITIIALNRLHRLWKKDLFSSHVFETVSWGTKRNKRIHLVLRTPSQLVWSALATVSSSIHHYAGSDRPWLARSVYLFRRKRRLACIHLKKRGITKRETHHAMLRLFFFKGAVATILHAFEGWIENATNYEWNAYRTAPLGRKPWSGRLPWRLGCRRCDSRWRP